MSLAETFAQYTQSPFTAFATSAFKSHSQLAAAGIISRVFSIATYTVVPKILDNVGRISPTAFLVFVVFQIISDAMMAGCKNVQTYLGAHTFTGMSGTGQGITSQVYFGSTTNIVERGFYNVAADSFSHIISMYSGAEIGGRILDDWGKESGWRWGYGMWCIIQFVMSIPFLAILYSWTMRVRRTPGMDPLPKRGSILYQLFSEYDVVGMVLLVGGLCLILVPLTLAKGVASKWDGSNVAMLCVGCVLTLFFVLWSLPKRWRPKWLYKPSQPLIGWFALKNRSLLAFIIINGCDFMSYAIIQTYAQSYFQVAAGLSAARATQVDNTIRITFQVFALAIGIIMRYWTWIARKLGFGPNRHFHTAWAIWLGIPIGLLSMGLDIWFFSRPRASNAVGCFVGAKVMYGFARAMFQTCGQVQIQAAAKRENLGVATGIFYMAMSLGGAIGTAVAGAIWANDLPDQLRANLPAASKALAPKIFGSIKVAMEYKYGTEIGDSIIQSYANTMRLLAIVATCIQVPMFIAMFFIHDIGLTEDEQIVEAGRRIAMGKRTEREELEKLEREKADKLDQEDAYAATPSAGSAAADPLSEKK